MTKLNYSTYIFDFDGTLFDSRIGILNGVKYALDYFQIEHPNEETLLSFIGPPLGQSFQRNVRLSKEDSLLAIQKLREYYGDKGILESQPYPGIFELLQSLQQNKKQIAIATAKPTNYALQILNHHQWINFFHAVKGSSLKGELFPKEQTIAEVMEELSLVDKEKVVMIGDTIYDIKGGQHHDISTIAVNYGYGKKQDLKDARPNFFVETVKELHKLIL